ncbi:type II toxin-antitoxin system PemK/MazF family toxin [Cellulomonas sp. S1-8]|uniref:type II toxin-antitoxin system PemK/MazF family toxin n=1 Tax=Cellulomonas sp. S1-8 TaxID=2904790 RepID=UPI002244163C|nr:type II toxin-antitoxin system PemK/MazF family toxin [Cellulomonas sp. S1-8]UZN03011.1 type II toxin-antitoxin system PemK/MazF family toxin [Cellulomonas sp. S1-8]
MIDRGSVCWVDFGEPRGSEPGKQRPAVVVQADDFNRSAIGTVVVVPLTSNTSLAAVPGNVFVPRVASGLAKDSVANVSQVTVASREYVTYPVASLPADLVAAIDDGLRLVLAL